jgi:lipoate-protein ligase A
VALGELGLSDLTVHRGRLALSRWGRLVCFAGVGAGEVLAGGRKVVGISQRRTRHAVRFQCVALREWDPARLLDVLELDELARLAAERDLDAIATGTAIDPARMLDAVLAGLTSGGAADL